MPKELKKVRDNIIIKGARVNNLKNIDIEIPRDKLVVVTGLSGSGKSSLAFDVVYAEGNRRYLEGMSSYARQFLDVSVKPDVDKIENLSPTISIDQKSIGRSLRSTVGTLTEIYDYLRVLFSKIGVPHCPKCGASMSRREQKEILNEILDFPQKTQIAILARIKDEKKSPQEIVRSISQLGYARVRLNGKVMLTDQAIQIVSDKMENNIEVVVDRIVIDKKRPDKERILDSIETALKIGDGSLIVCVDNDQEIFFNRHYVCHDCNFKIEKITPKNFSFNSPYGACPSCSGLGITKEVDEELVVPNKKLAIIEGAIMPWSKSLNRASSGGNLQLLKNLGEQLGFSLEDPIEDISPDIWQIILYGTSGKVVSSSKKKDLGGINKNEFSYSGIIPILKKKYNESSSDYVRNEIEKYMVEKICPTCCGKRLKEESLAILIQDKSIDEIVDMSLEHFLEFLKELRVSGNFSEVVASLVKEMSFRAKALCEVGLGYLSLSRGSYTLSGGEAQRIRLASQLNSELMGIVYVLDEPSIGLHDRDTERLIKTMHALKDIGNSLIVVEHDEKIIKDADWVIDMGPGAGEDGGQLIFSGTTEKLLKLKSSTALYLTGRKKVSQKNSYRKGDGKFIEILGAQQHNLKNVDVKIPLKKLVSISGVSGSGKSTLINDILAKFLAKHFYKAKAFPGKFKKIKGISNIDKVINMDQSPIGRTPRSNAATYTGVFSLIRELFVETEEAKKRGYTASRFSFNMKGGRCEDCQGDGTKKIEMHLLPDMYVKCETCGGSRYNQGTLEIEYQGVNVAEVLDMSVSYALRFFSKSPNIQEKLRTLENVGLGYLKLGQSATNLSGGEAQRIKLATELSRKSTGKTLYILDEPTIGLHFEDIKKLLAVLDALVDKGNSVLIVEHNKDIINNSDWVIDLGPEGGEKGGEVVFAGTPDKLKKCKKSWTGKYL